MALRKGKKLEIPWRTMKNQGWFNMTPGKKRQVID
jgi:hypothetical protein